MKRTAALMAIVGVLMIGAGCSKNAATTTNTNTTYYPPVVNTDTTNTNSDHTTLTTNTNTGTVTSPSTANVTIADYAFSSADLTVKKGTVVTWKSSGPHEHMIVWENGGQANSQVLNVGDTYTATFGTVGTFSYHCYFHPSLMEGSVTVTE